MLKGEKVLLRPMLPDDIERQHIFNQDAELYLLDGTYPRPAPREAAEAFYEHRKKSEGVLIALAIEADGIYIGSCELMRPYQPDGSYELGIQIGDRAYWGQGYGRDAVRVLLDYGFRLCGARRILLSTHAKNERAIRCYHSCGFVEEDRSRKAVWIDTDYTDGVNMSMLGEEWQQHRGYPHTDEIHVSSDDHM